jgi:hypothetical protein
MTYFKQIVRAGWALLIVAALLATSISPTQAAPAAQVASAPSFSFEEMGFGSSELASPSDARSFFFSLPAGQQIASGAELNLSLRTLILDTPGVDLSDEELRGAITVELNGRIVANLPLTRELEREVTLPIPDSALEGQPADGRHDLRIRLQTPTDCAFGDAIRVTIGANSSLTLPTDAEPISADLALLPRPIFQRSFLPETAIVVVPDEPTAEELRAVMIVAAGLGRSSGNQLGLTLRQSSELTDEEYEANHLVFVGTPAALPLLSEIELPASVEDALFAAPNLEASDGIVQAAVSPWNEAKLALVIGGNIEAGVVKAAQAFALNQLLPVEGQPDLAIIADVNLAADENPPVERTFADLGYADARRTGAVGISSLYYDFTLPVDQIATDEAFLELAFTHSALMNYNSSSLTVLLNGASIGGVRFSDDSVDLTRVSFLMPRDALRPGRNEIQLRASLNPNDGCFNNDELDLWLSIWPESRISVPLEPATDQMLRSLGLGEYPTMLTGSPSLATTAFVVDQADANSWQTAAQVVSQLATQSNSAPIDLAVAYDGAVPEAVLQERNLVLFGQPSALSMVEELNAALPAPFDPGSDQAIDRVTRVTFRLADRTDVGYLQLLTAPWNEQRVVLAVLGRSPEGLDAAGQSLIRGALRSRLGGSFALIIDEQIFIGGTRLAVAPPEVEAPAVTDPAPDATSTAILTDTTQPVTAPSDATAPSAGPPLLLALVVSVMVMLLVVGGVVGWSYYRRRS